VESYESRDFVAVLRYLRSRRQSRRSARAVGSLPLPLKLPFELVYFERLPVEEVAELLGISRERVHRRLQRARKHIHSRLRKAQAGGTISSSTLRASSGSNPHGPGLPG
jgi:DNA-directed RNA polymerase specialized sigma24 family protein